MLAALASTRLSEKISPNSWLKSNSAGRCQPVHRAIQERAVQPPRDPFLARQYRRAAEVRATHRLSRLRSRSAQPIPSPLYHFLINVARPQIRERARSRPRLASSPGEFALVPNPRRGQHLWGGRPGDPRQPRCRARPRIPPGVRGRGGRRRQASPTCLRDLAVRLRSLLGVDGTIVGIVRSNRLVSEAADGYQVPSLERLVDSKLGGPTTDAATVGRDVVVDDLRTRAGDWPTYAAAAERAGVSAVAAIPDHGQQGSRRAHTRLHVTPPVARLRAEGGRRLRASGRRLSRPGQRAPGRQSEDPAARGSPREPGPH